MPKSINQLLEHEKPCRNQTMDLSFAVKFFRSERRIQHHFNQHQENQNQEVSTFSSVHQLVVLVREFPGLATFRLEQ